jgi:hypothetical protein
LRVEGSGFSVQCVGCRVKVTNLFGIFDPLGVVLHFLEGAADVAEHGEQKQFLLEISGGVRFFTRSGREH